LLSVVVAVVVALGITAAPLLVTIIAPGYEGELRALTIHLVRLIFPGTGLLVWSAWCLGILNSHRRFLLSYAAPVAWNAVQIGALLAFRAETQDTLVTILAWGYVVGCVAQLGVQVPSVLGLLKGFAPRPSLELPAVRQVVSGFLPAMVARGVVQVSAWVDAAYASLITATAVSALSYTQNISMLPISLFGMAITAAELPEMSADAMKSHDERADALRTRLGASLARLAFFIAPSSSAFLFLGDAISGVLLESGRYGPDDSRLTWYILIGSAVALTAQTSGRLYSSAFYALKDTRTPFKFALVRVSLGIVLGYYAVQILPGQLGLPRELGVVFITITTGVTAWLEMTLLRRALRQEIGRVKTASSLRIWLSALLAGLAALGVKVALTNHFGPRLLTEWGGSVLAPPKLPVFPTSAGLIAVFCLTYLVLTLLLGVPQSRSLLRRLFKA
jgi:putative peptidoglycan lipid II flippase